MKTLVILLLTLSLASCATVLERFETKEGTPSIPPPAKTLTPDQNVGELLKHRVFLCQQDKNIRADQLKQLRAKAQKTRKLSTNNQLSLNDKLDGLLLTTCDVAITPALFNEMLQIVTNEDGWPADYLALFELLKSQQKSLIQLQNYAQELNRELDTTKIKLDAVQTEHQKTIKSIGDIEENLDSRNPKSRTPR